MNCLRKEIIKEILLGNKKKAVFYAEILLSNECELVDLYFIAFSMFKNKDYQQCVFYLSLEKKGICLIQCSMFGVILMLECLLLLEDKEKMETWLKKSFCFDTNIDFDISFEHGFSITKNELSSKIFYLKGQFSERLGKNKETVLGYYIQALEEDQNNFEALHAIFYGGLFSYKEREEFILRCKEKSSTLSLSAFSKNENITKETTMAFHVQIEKALKKEEYRKAASICKKQINAFGLLSETPSFYIAALYSLSDVPELYSLSINLAEAQPTNSLSWYAVGVFNMLIGKYEESLRYLCKSLSLDPKNVLSLVAAGHAHSLLGANNLSLLSYRKAQKIMPKAFRINMYIGMESISLGEMDTASEYFVNALDIEGVFSKIDPVLLNEIGVLYYKQREYRKSLGCFEKSLNCFNLKQQKNRRIVLQNVGLVLMRLGLFEEAEKRFLEIESRDGYLINVCLGFISEWKGLEEKAVSFYHAAHAPPYSGVVTMLLNPLMKKISLKE